MFKKCVQEFIKYTSRAELPTNSLQKGLELMLSIPQRATDLAYIHNIESMGQGQDASRFGRLLRHVGVISYF